MCEKSDAGLEARLLERAKAGDTSAFDEIITRHRDHVYMHAYQIIRNEEDALDLSQETFIKAWKSLSRFDGWFPLSAWLRRIVTNAAIDLCRSRQRRPQVELEGQTLRPDAASRTTPAAFDTPGKSLEISERKARIEAAFLELSPEHRAVVVLKEYEGLSYAEIAKTMNTSVGTVMSRLFYARKKLQTLLSDLRT